MKKTMFELVNEAYGYLTDPIINNNVVEEATEYVNPPSKCDVCSAKIGNVFYDAKLKHYGWGNVCHSCFNQHGGDLGVGKGQKYKLNPETKKYEKVEGAKTNLFKKKEKTELKESLQSENTLVESYDEVFANIQAKKYQITVEPSDFSVANTGGYEVGNPADPTLGLAAGSWLYFPPEVCFHKAWTLTPSGAWEWKDDWGMGSHTFTSLASMLDSYPGSEPPPKEDMLQFEDWIKNLVAKKGKNKLQISYFLFNQDRNLSLQKLFEKEIDRY